MYLCDVVSVDVCLHTTVCALMSMHLSIYVCACMCFRRHVRVRVCDVPQSRFLSLGCYKNLSLLFVQCINFHSVSYPYQTDTFSPFMSVLSILVTNSILKYMCGFQVMGIE